MSDLTVLDWSLKRVADLAALGVRRITLTQKAARVLTGTFRNEYVVGTPIYSEPNKIGEVCGISFFVEPEASHG